MRTGRTLGTMDPTFNGYVTVPPKPPEHGGLGGLTVVPDAARWLNERQEIETDEGERVLVQSAFATRRLEMGVLLPSAMHALSADDECAHGGLPVDPKPQPGCTPACAGYPRTPEPEEAISVSAITETHHGSAASDAADPDAPYGRKEDGTPRKKPAPSPEHIAAIQRGHAERKAARLAAQAATAVAEAPPAPAEAPVVEPEADPTPAPRAPVSALVARWLDEIDVRTHEIIGERAALLAQVAQLEAEAEELGAALERLVGVGT